MRVRSCLSPVEGCGMTAEIARCVPKRRSAVARMAVHEVEALQCRAVSNQPGAIMVAEHLKRLPGAKSAARKTAIAGGAG